MHVCLLSIFNDLTSDINSSSSLHTFKQRLFRTLDRHLDVLPPVRFAPLCDLPPGQLAVIVCDRCYRKPLFSVTTISSPVFPFVTLINVLCMCVALLQSQWLKCNVQHVVGQHEGVDISAARTQSTYGESGVPTGEPRGERRSRKAFPQPPPGDEGMKKVVIVFCWKDYF